MRHRLVDVAVPGWVDPASAARTLLAGEPNAVFLDSGIHADSGMSVIAVGSRHVTADVGGSTITVDGVTTPGSILDFLRGELDDLTAEPGTGFRLGWVGWLGYGLGDETLGRRTTRHSDHPDASLLFIDRAVIFDHRAHSISLVALDSTGTQQDLWRSRTEAALRSEPIATGQPATKTVATWHTSDADYLEQIAECQRHIADGDAYQLCLTTEVNVATNVDPLETYLALRQSSPSHHGAYFAAGGVALLSASPEQFLAVSPGGVVESKPIKGTRPRGATAEADEALKAELLASGKERAENLMIVDLMRNDIGRVSEIGSVEVPSLLAVESYRHVHQLVSTIRGRLRPGLTAIDAVQACFPAGSMTGAPKYGAVAILEGLEQRARGLYSGAFGYFGLDGRVDLSVIIRSIVLDAAGATIGAGGGITALSVAAEELAEVKLKAAALLAVLGAG
jgi:anthranilate synthase component 1